MIKITAIVFGVVGTGCYIYSKYVEKYIEDLKKYNKFPKNTSQNEINGNYYISGKLKTDDPLKIADFDNLVMYKKKIYKITIFSSTSFGPSNYDKNRNCIAIGNPTKNTYHYRKLIEDGKKIKSKKVTLDGVDITSILNNFNLKLLCITTIPSDDNYDDCDNHNSIYYTNYNYGIKANTYYTICGSFKNGKFDAVVSPTILKDTKDFEKYIQNKQTEIGLLKIISSGVLICGYLLVSFRN